MTDVEELGGSGIFKVGSRKRLWDTETGRPGKESNSA